MVPSPVLKPAIPERSFVVSSSFPVDHINNEVRVSPVWQTREGRGRFMDSQVPCWLQSGLNTCQPSSREVPWYLVLSSSSTSLWPREMQGMGAISFPQLPSQAVPHMVKNSTTRAECNAAVCTQAQSFKTCGTNCLQNPESLGFSSHSQALLEFMAFLSLFLLLPALLFLQAFYGNTEATLLAQQIHQSTFICLSSTKAGKVLLESVCEAVVRWPGCEQEAARCWYLPTIWGIYCLVFAIDEEQMVFLVLKLLRSTFI